LQSLVDRLLAPHRKPHVVERRQYPRSLRTGALADPGRVSARSAVVRDYDTSIPELRADREQLIQTVLNIAQNACQALDRTDPRVMRN
jgi:two-component system nitrogen regulation sensor histidine kinase GlnL